MLFPTSGRACVWRTPKEAHNPECIVPTRGRFCDGFGGNIVVQYSVGLTITLHDRITAREYVDRLCNQVHPMIQTLRPNSNAVFQDDNALFTYLKLFTHGLKSMKVNFNIFPGQHNHQI
jgi:hypothetical protein